MNFADATATQAGWNLTNIAIDVWNVTGSWPAHNEITASPKAQAAARARRLAFEAVPYTFNPREVR
jgi:hypothetical protein